MNKYLIIIGVLLGIFATFLVWQRLDEQQAQMSTIDYLAVGSLDGDILAEGEALEERYFDTITVPESPDTQGLGTRLIRDTPQNREWILGAKLNRPVPTGQILTYDMFEPLVGLRLDTMISPGMRATTINVNDENSLNNKIVPGNRIDILGVTAGTAGTPDIGEIILEDVQVLAVGDATSLSEFESGSGDYSTITIEVTNAQALTLITRKETLTGGFNLLLRNQCDTVAAGDTCG